jgi:uncharacterized protein (DUF1015 family)
MGPTESIRSAPCYRPLAAMPIIRPLRALHYGSDIQPHLGELITPATVGEPSDRSEVGEVHEFNIRRLVRGDFGPLAGDDEPSFTHAARLLAGWKERGVLVRDPRPALYVYEQEWQGLVRRGLVSLVRLSPYGSGEILPHEETGGDSTEVLLRQLQMTTTQLSMTMSILADENGVLSRFLESFDAAGAGLQTVDGNGITSRVWRDEDPAVHLELGRALRERCAVLADGHHRYQAALRYQQWRRETKPRPGRRREHPCDYIMMMLVPASSPGLLCQPTHRVCERLNRSAQGIVDRLGELFEMTDVDSDEELFAFLGDAGGTRFAMVRPGRRTTMLLKDRSEERLLSLPASIRSVDAAILQELVLTPMDEALGSAADSMADLSISQSPWAHNRRSGAEVAAKVLSGGADLAILVRPPAPMGVLRAAMEGGLMPPKSTNFHPKPVKGMLINSLHSF